MRFHDVTEKSCLLFNQDAFAWRSRKYESRSSICHDRWGQFDSHLMKRRPQAVVVKGKQIAKRLPSRLTFSLNSIVKDISVARARKVSALNVERILDFLLSSRRMEKDKE